VNRLFLAVLCGTWLAGGIALRACAAEITESPIVPRAGSEVSTFFVRDFSTSNPSSAICLVCRYGDRPVVMVCGHVVDQQVRRLLQALSGTVEARRATGLRAFGVFLDEKDEVVQPRLLGLVRRQEVTFPLTIAVENVAGPREWSLLDGADTAVVLYEQRKVVACFRFSAGQLAAEQVEQVVRATEQLAAGAARRGAAITMSATVP